MHFDRIHFILNPSSGQEEPILSYINSAFEDSKIKWEVSVTKESGDAGRLARELVNKTDLIAVYGGDGSVAEVSEALIGTNKPMAIIAGGTANVMAKELGLPISSVEALQLLKDGNVKIEEIDSGEVNGTPFILRVNFGILADMILDTNRELKNSLGQLAYGITTLQTVAKAEPSIYEMIIDGERFVENGVALTVTNSGSIGISDYAFLPGISITDGLLDVILLQDTDIATLFKVAGSTLLKSDSNVLKHWKCKEIKIQMQKEVNLLCDDWKKTLRDIEIKVRPKSLLVVVPKDKILA